MDYTDLSKEFLQTIYSFCRAGQQRQFTNAVHGEAFALQFIAQHDDVAIPSDIENAMSISSARIAIILNGLEDKGLITRRIDPSDRRRTILKLTPEGEKQVAASTEHLLGLSREMLEFLGEVDARHFVRIMSRLVEKCNANNIDNDKCNND